MIEDILDKLNDKDLIIIQATTSIIRDDEKDMIKNIKDNPIIGYKIEAIFYTKDYLIERNKITEIKED